MFASADETAILATESRPLAIGLSALLLSIPPIHHVKLVPDTDVLCETIEENRPLLVVIDSAMADRLPEISWQVCQLAPNSLHILLSDDATDARELADHAGITVIMKGTDPRQLARALETLLNEHVARLKPTG